MDGGVSVWMSLHPDPQVPIIYFPRVCCIARSPPWRFSGPVLSQLKLLIVLESLAVSRLDIWSKNLRWMRWLIESFFSDARAVWNGALFSRRRTQLMYERWTVDVRGIQQLLAIKLLPISESIFGTRIWGPGTAVARHLGSTAAVLILEEICACLPWL